MSTGNEKPFNRETMRQVFQRMGEVFHEKGLTIEIAVYGGSALALNYDWRENTRDIDYSPVNTADDIVGQVAADVMRELDLPFDGLRPDVTIFISDNPQLSVNAEFPPATEEGTGLRVFTATPEYILAMKCKAMRSSLETDDIRDIWHLIGECGFNNEEEVFAVVEQFYPDDELPKRNKLIIGDIFKEKGEGKDFNPMIGW